MLTLRESIVSSWEYIYCTHLYSDPGNFVRASLAARRNFKTSGKAEMQRRLHSMVVRRVLVPAKCDPRDISGSKARGCRGPSTYVPVHRSPTLTSSSGCSSASTSGCPVNGHMLPCFEIHSRIICLSKSCQEREIKGACSETRKEEGVSACEVFRPANLTLITTGLITIKDNGRRSLTTEPPSEISFQPVALASLVDKGLDFELLGTKKVLCRGCLPK